MPGQISQSRLGDLVQTAKTHAIGGAAAGIAVVVIHGLVSVRNRQIRDRYAVATEGLTYIGTGAILGVMAATITALAGVSVAAIAGRGVLAVAVPMVASTLVTDRAHERVQRSVRAWSEEFVQGLSRSTAPDYEPSAKNGLMEK